MNSAVEDVQALWERKQISNPNKATEADIAAFEGKYNVSLAPIVREYFRELNGTRFGELGMDDAEYLLGFWHLDQVQPVRDECPEYFHPDEPNLFIFADYSIWAFGYAIRLAPADDGATAVFLICGASGDKPVELAATFEEFLARYAAGDETVLYR